LLKAVDYYYHMQTITEGKARIKVHDGKPSKKLPVFYNPVMKHNRDISVLILNSINQKDMNICLPLAASGIRGIRFLKELKKGILKEIFLNDISPTAVKNIKENLRLNKIKSSQSIKINISQKNADRLLSESKGLNYVDIDPFGSPNLFLDPACKRISRDGILAVTATDTGCLAGTFPTACRRKYWSNPSRDDNMHETGLRILIRKVQLIGAQYDKALIPVYSYFKDHYFRIFFRCEKGRKKADEIIRQHKYILKGNTGKGKKMIGNKDKDSKVNDIGPLWTGPLWDKSLAKNICEEDNFSDPELSAFLRTIADESKIETPGFFDIHQVCKRNRIKKIPKTAELIEKIKTKGFKTAKTHFRINSIRSGIPEKELIDLMKK
ncbi:MAG: tRNA (guanine(10)-N(2))-dimethyltransferase, partial [Candidatus Woesearchaeota archaeon]